MIVKQKAQEGYLHDWINIQYVSSWISLDVWLQVENIYKVVETRDEIAVMIVPGVLYTVKYVTSGAQGITIKRIRGWKKKKRKYKKKKINKKEKLLEVNLNGLLKLWG